MSATIHRSFLTLFLLGALLAACSGQTTEPTATPLPPTQSVLSTAPPVQPTLAPAPTATPAAAPSTPTPTAEAPEVDAESEPAFAAKTPETATVPESGASLPDSPFAARGPYAVGTRPYGVPIGDKTIDAVIWYPATNPDQRPEKVTYKINPRHPYVAGGPIQGRAISNAAPDATGGPYPLVIFSTGLTGWSQTNSYLLEHLASHGFVVISADPRGENLQTFWQGAAFRPLDTERLIAFGDELTAADGDLAGLVDTDHIAIAGHSSGGWTALVGGGAQFDWSWCDANSELVAKTELSNCPQFVSYQEEIAALLGLDSAPTGTWPQMYDPRVDAVIAISPDGDIWGADYQGVAGVEVPTLVIIGSKDTVTVPEYGAYPIYEHLGSAKKSLIVFENAGHYIFANQCRDTPWMIPQMMWFCADAVWDMDRAHDLTKHFITAFLMAELTGDADAATTLAPENVAFPDIRYETTGYDIAPAP